MPDPRPGQEGLFGLMAEFGTPQDLREACQQVRDAGYRAFDAHTPFPVEGLAVWPDGKDAWIAWLTLAGGIAGAATGIGMQVYTNLDYPLVVGGRPPIAWPAFAMIAFELMVLGAVLSAILGMLILNRLPRLHHPVFAIEGFERASTDRFFLVIQADDTAFHPEKTRAFLAGLNPLRVEAIGQGEAPE